MRKISFRASFHPALLYFAPSNPQDAVDEGKNKYEKWILSIFWRRRVDCAESLMLENLLCWPRMPEGRLASGEIYFAIRRLSFRFCFPLYENLLNGFEALFTRPPNQQPAWNNFETFIRFRAMLFTNRILMVEFEFKLDRNFQHCFVRWTRGKPHICALATSQIVEHWSIELSRWERLCLYWNCI